MKRNVYNFSYDFSYNSKTGILIIDTIQITYRKGDLIYITCKTAHLLRPCHSYMHHQTPPDTTRPSEVFRESLPKVQTLYEHCDGDIKNESEGDPAAAPVDGGHVHRRR